MKKVLILFSGGADSTLLVRMAQAIDLEPVCLLIDYGQKHIAELTVAERFCKKNNLQFTKVELKNLNIHSKLKDGEVKYSGVSEWHVPGRNAMFISAAASIAESEGIDLIWYGANYEDREHLFPDCYQEWVYKMNSLLAVNGSQVIKLEAPLLGMQKNTILGLLEMFNVKPSEIYSGYGELENKNKN